MSVASGGSMPRDGDRGREFALHDTSLRRGAIVPLFMITTGTHKLCRRAVEPGRRRRSQTRSDCGFTILEVLLAGFVMVLAISSSLIVLQRAFCGLDVARKQTLAGQIMQSEIEKMRLEDWITVSGYPASSDITAAAQASFGASGVIANTFIVNRAVSDVHADMKQITLTTAWKTIDGRTMSRSYTTYYGRNGLYDYFYNSY